MKKTEFFIKNKFEVKRNVNGNIYKILNKNSKFFKGFGELYITTINKGASKGWNFHKRITSNLFVIRGKVKVLMKKNDNLVKKIISENSNETLTIKPKVWFKIVNLTDSKSKVINFANLKYSHNEILKKEILWK